MAVDQEPRKWIDDESTRRIMGLFLKWDPPFYTFVCAQVGSRARNP